MGLYEKVKALVHSFKISGTFYHEAEESEHLEHLQPGDTIDYRSCLTRWVERIDEDEPIILKLTCEQAPGLRLKTKSSPASVDTKSSPARET